jgi:hypothetical protein
MAIPSDGSTTERIQAVGCRVVLTGPPFPDVPASQQQTPWWEGRRSWPTDWIAHAVPIPAPAVVLYRCRFRLATAGTVRIHVSGDERYALFLDGVLVGDGPERCDPNRWAYETYDLALHAGDHRLVARVWSAGEHAPWGQTTVRHGFICAPQSEEHSGRLGTGIASWESCVDRSWSFTRVADGQPQGMGSGMTLDASLADPELALGNGSGWAPVTRLEPGNNGRTEYVLATQHRMRPAALPAQERRHLDTARVVHCDEADESLAATRLMAEEQHLADRAAAIAGALAGRPLRLERGERLRAVIDLGRYACIIPHVVASGRGGTIALRYAEAGTTMQGGVWAGKDRRDVVRGRVLLGVPTDRLRTAMRAVGFSPLWWRAGRFVEVLL